MLSIDCELSADDQRAGAGSRTTTKVFAAACMFSGDGVAGPLRHRCNSSRSRSSSPSALERYGFAGSPQ